MDSLVGAGKADNEEEQRLTDERVRPSTQGRYGLPQRCSSVLGVHSPDRDVYGTLRNSGQMPVLDYVDLECLLQEKLKEVKIQMPKSRKGRRKREHITALDESDEGCANAVDRATKDVDVLEYSKRIQEASFLFGLCQQEIQLQVDISCPERSRLTDKTLEFFSTVLHCLTKPYHDACEELSALRKQRMEERNEIKKVLDDMYSWTKENRSRFNHDVFEQICCCKSHEHWIKNCSNENVSGESYGFDAFIENVQNMWNFSKCTSIALVQLKEKFHALQDDSVSKQSFFELEHAQNEAQKKIIEFQNQLNELHISNQSKVSELKEAETISQQRIAHLEQEIESRNAQAELSLKESSASISELQNKVEELLNEEEQLQIRLSHQQGEMEQQLKENALLKESSSSFQNKLKEANEKIEDLTNTGVVLTPRPDWKSFECCKSLQGSSSEIARSLCTQLETSNKSLEDLGKECSATSQMNGSLQKELAEERSNLSEANRKLEDLKSKLDSIENPKRANASCGCPERREGFVMVPLSEYLTSYLSKRFGLKGEMASWEVERMQNEMGWVLEAEVGMRSEA
uniref:Uncharacterized protein n=1 Tax=Hanusia phi TaxID=3032 RepID=A0A7S0F0Q6_9CRYP